MNRFYKLGFIVIAIVSFLSCAKEASTYTGTWITYTTKDSLICNSVNAIAVDKNNNVWFGTSNGVSHYDSIPYYDSILKQTVRWRSYVKELVNVCVNAITIDAQGNKWFGTRNGISKFDGSHWTVFNTDDGLVNNTITALATDSSNVLWVGTVNGLSKFDGTNWITYNTVNTNNGLASNYIYTIYVDKYNDKWIGTQAGISKFDGLTWVKYDTANSKIMNNSVYSVAFDLYDNIWFGTATGLSELNLSGGVSTWTNYATINPKSNNYFSSILVDKDDKKWVGTNGLGLWVFLEPNWTVYTKSDGLAFNTVNAVVFDKWKRFWFATGMGVTHYLP